MVDPKSSGESSGIPEKVNRFASGPSRLPALFPGVYVGASSTERELAFQYAEKLRDAGARITYAWWETRQKFQNDAALSLENARGFTERNVFGIAEAWRVWLLFPEQPAHMKAIEQPIISRGLCGETGICIGMGRKFIVSGPWKDFMFASHAEKHFETHDSALSYLVGEINPVRREELMVEEIAGSLSGSVELPSFDEMLQLATGLPK